MNHPTRPEILVLGIGNLLLRDESVGIQAITALERDYQFPDTVELVDGGTAGFELLGQISRRKHLILIDAIACGQKPGTVVRVEGEDVPATFMHRISPHQLGISDVLAAARLTDELPAGMVLFGVEPSEISTGLELSDTVQASFPKLVSAIADEINRLAATH